ncbi:ATP-binding protein [Chlamydiota bacterium]
MKEYSIRERVRQEAALLKERIGAVLDKGGDLVFKLNKNGQIVFVNDTARNVLGYSKRELTSHAFSYFVSRKDKKRVSRAFIKVYEKEMIALPFLFEVRCRNGKKKCFELISAELIAEQNLERQLIQIVYHDLTEKTETKRILDERAEELEVLNAIISFCNSFFEMRLLCKEILSYLLKTFSFKGGAFCLFDETGECLRVLSQKSLSDVYQSFLEHLIIDTDLSKKIVKDCNKIFTLHLQQYEGYSIPDSLLVVPLASKGQVVGALCLYSHTSKKISDRKRDLFLLITQEIAAALKRIDIDAKIETVAREWRTTVDSINEMVSLQDRDCQIIRVNRAFATSLNKDYSQILGKSCFELIHPAEGKRDDCPIIRAMKTKKTVTHERYEPLLGIFLEESVSPIFDEKGRVIATVRIAKDITERKHVENLKDEFVTTVSHELRTPLTIIKESITLLEDELLGPVNKKQKKCISYSVDAIDRLYRLISDLLDISRIESGNITLHKEKVNFTVVLQKVVSSLAATAKRKGLRVIQKVPQRIVSIWVDKEKIIEVLTNLLENAIKFTKKGSISIVLIQKPTAIECSISDTGIGISQENLPKVFDKFQQFGRTYGPGIKGTGLGLSICKNIIDLHKGTIAIKSYLHKGTTVIFSLPRQVKQKKVK